MLGVGAANRKTERRRNVIRHRSVGLREIESITRLSTSWKHRCGKCGHEDWADASYPRVAYLPIDAIGPDDSYT
jgi:hypothetical protein